MRRSTMILAAALAAFGPAWLPGHVDVAHAQQDDKAARAEASKHFKLGVRLYAESKFDEALIEFERAYALSPHPSVLFNIAASHRELSHYAESIQFYEQFLAEAKGKVKDELLTRAQEELDEVRNRVGTVNLKIQPDGVEVSIDGRELGTTPLDKPVVLGPGRHTFTLRAPSGKVETRRITLASGDMLPLEVDMRGPDTGTTAVDGVPPVNGAGTSGGTTGAGGIAMDAEPAAGGRGMLGLSAGFATNARLIGDTGAPVVGAHLRTGRLVFGADVILVAWAVMPSVRVHLAGSDTLGVHATLAVPVSFTDGDVNDVFVAGAAGLGLRMWLAGSLAVRAEALASVAGDDHGVNFPISLGVELWR